MKLFKRFAAALLASALALTMLCSAAFAIAAPETEKTAAQRQEILALINQARQNNELPALVETPEADAQAARMAALYFSTDDEDEYDAQWMAILQVEVHGLESGGDAYTWQMEDGNGNLHWDLVTWEDYDLMPYPQWALLQCEDTVEVGIAFEKNGGAVLMPYVKPSEE